ncbi:hypothetical protein HHK36_025271 [Tetracentron sinense]|uniref:ubiquitinyl hydrolase 1 n=1 Tax=Tetracentron sinense TaxID=13715 RepID=A0A834YKT6_TETSI|nr:hypothetical protein HHK36_025271 [Tetracentron sinense]
MMQSKEELVADGEMECVSSNPALAVDDWANFRDNDIMQQQTAIQAEEAEKMPFVGDKARAAHALLKLYAVKSWLNLIEEMDKGTNQEPLSALAAEYQSGSSVLQEKIKVLDEQYAGIRRTRGDGNCFFRSFMFSYLFTPMRCKSDHYEHNFQLFLEQLESVLQGNGTSISAINMNFICFSHDELVLRSRDQSISDYVCCLVVMFFRFVTSGEIRRRSEFFEPFVMGLTNATVEQFCKSSVEPMGEESDHVHIIALSDALGVPIRVVYLDRSSSDTGAVSVNHHDFIPAVDPHNATAGSSGTMIPFITLLYRPGHYDILYPK